MTTEHKKTLEAQLWGVANLLRGKMHADEYKNYILGFIFYKYLSEKIETCVDTELLASESLTFAQLDSENPAHREYLEALEQACVEDLGFFLLPTELFARVVAQGQGEVAEETTFILEDLRRILTRIEQTASQGKSEEDFAGLFGDVDLTSNKLGSSEEKKNTLIVEVLTKLAEIDFGLEEAQSDVLGDAYEYLIGEFAAGAGKKGGEFYTPAQVSRLLARIVTSGKSRVRSVYDPTCGSGSLLLRVKDYARVVDYYGQELNPTTYNLARMNMILHGVHYTKFKIVQGDTLADDRLPELQAEAIVANPPFSAKWKSDTDPVLASDERFAPYGRLAPKSAADYAFVTHMLSKLADNGTLAVVLPHGVLFRSGAEASIRTHLIDKLNYLDAVIGLPANLFYGTSIPACILVFKKCRELDENILFVDASGEFEKAKNQNYLSDENLDKILTTYENRQETAKYSHRATLDEIRENDFNLNIPRYVDTFEAEEEIDLDTVTAEIAETTQQLERVNKEIAAYCQELGINPPF